MQRSDWKQLGGAAIVLSLSVAAFAAQPGTQTPKASGPQAYTYWVGDPSGSRGSYLGVDVTDISKDRIGTLKLKDEHGVEVTMVDQDAPAGKAGLKEHDVILEFNGQRVEGEEELKRLIHETPAGRKITLGISRDGQTMQLPVTLGERSKTTTWSSGAMVAPHAYAMPTIPPMPPVPAIPAMEFEMPDVNISIHSYSPSTGMMVDNLTPQLGEFFGVKSGQGVLVRSVEKGSAAEASGLKAGDVIVKIGEDKIGDRSDFRRAIRDHKSAKLPLGIIRDKKEQTLTITLSGARTGKDSSRMDRFLRRDKNGDLIEDDDADFDMDWDSGNWEGSAALLAPKAQTLAFADVQKSLLTAQKAARSNMDSWQKMQPQFEEQMKKMQRTMREQMKQMEKQMREWQDNE
jgi:serine protease Do